MAIWTPKLWIFLGHHCLSFCTILIIVQVELRLNHSFYVIQAWILAREIGQCQAKIQVMSEESCFTVDTVVPREVKKKCKLQTFWNLQAFGGHRPFLLRFYEHFNRQFTYVLMQFSPAWDSFSAENILYVIT